MARQVRKPRNIDETLSGRLQSRVSALDIPVPTGVTIYVTDSRVGRYRVNALTVTVPVWAYNATTPKTKGDPEYAIYYIAHELAHAWADHDGNDPNNHDADFYDWFKKLCPAHLWHYELNYKGTAAKRAGIVPNPEANRCRAVASAATHRPAAGPGQDTEAYDAYVDGNPTLKNALTNVSDRERLSFIRGWAKLDPK